MPSRTVTTKADQEAYNAIISTFKVIRHANLRLFSDEGITESQLQALGLLVDDGPMLMRKMSDAMLVTPANVTGIVDRLEEKQLVRRTSHKGDRRATFIEITAEGRTLYARVAEKKREMIQKALAIFTKEELLILYGLLQKFQKGISSSIGER